MKNRPKEQLVFWKGEKGQERESLTTSVQISQLLITRGDEFEVTFLLLFH